jgi:hypothetical protein
VSGIFATVPVHLAGPVEGMLSQLAYAKMAPIGPIWLLQDSDLEGSMLAKRVLLSLSTILVLFFGGAFKVSADELEPGKEHHAIFKFDFDSSQKKTEFQSPCDDESNTDPKCHKRKKAK